jgi:hypothetical protein
MTDNSSSTEELPDESDQTPISKRPADDAFAALKQQFLEDQKGNARWYSSAKEDYEFEAGRQLAEEDRAKLKADGRLIVEFNRVKPTVDVICGMEISGRQEVKCFPRTQASPYPEMDPATGQEKPPNPTDDDAEVNEGMSEAIRWARDNCDAEDEESDAFRDTVIAGMGWTETRMDYETDPEGKIVVERIDPMEMVWDCAATKRNLDDARRQGRVRKDIAIEEARQMFPGVDDSDLHAGWALEGQDDGDSIDHDREKARQYGNQGTKEKPRARVTLAIMEWFETKTEYQVFNPADQSTFIVDKKKLDELKEMVKGQIDPMTGQPIEVTSSPVKKRCWYRAFMGAKLLGKIKPAPCEDGSSYRCVTGYRDRNRKQWYGIVKHMKDPQQWANKFFSVALEQIASSGKGLIAEEGVTDDRKKFEADWAKTGNVQWVKTGFGEKVQPKPQPPLLTGLADLMSLSLQAIRDTTGVNQEALGATDRSQAASLEYQRTKQASVILASLFDNLRRYRKEQGRLLVYFIREYISDGRLIRVLGPQGNPKVLSLIRQPDTLQYDIIVDEAPSSPNQKEAAWLVTQQLLPVLMKDGQTPPQVLLEILRGSPLPESNVQRIQKAFQQAQKQQQEAGPSPQERQLEADIKKTEAEAAAKQMEAQMKAQELQMQKYEADLNAATTMETLKAQQQQQQFDMLKANQDAKAKEQEMAFNARMKELELQAAGIQQQHDMRMADMEARNTAQQQSHEREMGGMKMQGEAKKQEHDQKVRKMDLQAQTETEVAKNIPQKLPEVLEKVTEVMKEMMASQKKLEKAVLTKKTVKMSPDGMTATIEPAALH